jgi:tubulin--tyrosine ligase
MNIHLSKAQVSESFFKIKEVECKIKEKMNRFIWGILNASNNLEVELPEQNANGTYYQFGFKIGPGNNSYVIKRLMMERWWWNTYEKQQTDMPHFRWTQWRKNPIMDKLPSTTEFNEKHAETSLNSKSKVITPIGPDNTEIKRVKSTEIRVYNRLSGNFHLSNKKALFLNMRAYYQSISGEESHVFNFLPVTFHIKNGLEDPEFK